MPVLKRGTRAWHLLALAVIAVPWFLRDHLATTLEAQSQATQGILHGLDNERERQHTEREQRDTLQRLERMEILLRKIAKESSEDESATEQQQAYEQAVRAEGESLRGAVDVFEGLLAEAEPGESTRKTAEEAATAARSAAEQLEQQYGKGPEAQDEALLTQFDAAAAKLEAAFQALYDEADQRAKATEQQATLARFLAWMLTGLGALMVGSGSAFGGRAEGEAAEAAAAR